MKICPKESNESQLWLKHILIYEAEILESNRRILLQEASGLEKNLWSNFEKVELSFGISILKIRI